MLNLALQRDVEATCHTAVGCYEDEQHVLLGVVLGKQRLGVIEARAGHLGQHAGDGVLVRRSLLRAVQSLADARRGDHLHGAGHLRGALHRVDACLYVTKVCHKSCP